MLTAIFLLGVVSGASAEDDMLRRMMELRAKMNAMPDTAEEVKEVEEVAEPEANATPEPVEDTIKYYDETAEPETYSTEILDVKEIESDLEVDMTDGPIESEDFTPDSSVKEDMEEVVDEIEMQISEEMEDIEAQVEEELEDMADTETDMDIDEDVAIDDEDEVFTESSDLEVMLIDPNADESADYEYEFDYSSDIETESDTLLEEISAPVEDVDDMDSYDTSTDTDYEAMEEQITEDVDAIESEMDDAVNDLDDVSKNVTDELGSFVDDMELPAKSPAKVEDFETSLKKKSDTMSSELEEIERDIEDISIGLEEIVGQKIGGYKGN